jgi:hypothetical protein
MEQNTMTTKKAPSTAFKPGQSGNPAGKPKGARNHATRAVLKLIEGGAEEITLAVLDAAKAGDMGAARFILERIAPPIRERPVSIDLPDIGTAAGIAEAQAAILQAAADGNLLPGEASALSAITEARRKALETEELERRIAALEAKK